ncbi:ankyrin repeat protein, putative [Trichomonas vaginalis G3]|uniref:Ankyrin repeat protein, putative n=1 Tax=Trichomonas vaginalis (strain ATCC PRA-98 / G3) TaxID=412133 RepID=A2GBA5_TRIV3|nr:proteasome regulatory particle assembly [Trichomonas vaginalis G3]EAX85560.1 ankyrin repeat protein, putative [Trichomonas vaginalis G3]KAI5493750.1 proteasome regulatory particle assembly [Trichomonas vaginalis G3]|eukprot:XP_001298490.1 ankyrin repeat protein [Trichomonas vaginalis G3]
MYNDLERFIIFTEREGFDKDQIFYSELYPDSFFGNSLLELCCYYGAVDCFKLLRTKFNPEITYKCLRFSFLRGNKEIMSECLKYRKPDIYCMKYAIISHNIDFVTFLMNEYNLKIDLEKCTDFKNLESFLVYFGQTNDIYESFVYSSMFNIPSLCEYFLSLDIDINAKNQKRKTAIYCAVCSNSIETAKFLISHGVNINEKDEDGKTILHYATKKNYKGICEFLISHGANINEKDEYGKTALHLAVFNNNKEISELLISHGGNINEKDYGGETS